MRGPSRSEPQPVTYKVRCPDCGELLSSPIYRTSPDDDDGRAGWDLVLLARHHRRAPECPWHDRFSTTSGGEVMPSTDRLDNGPQPKNRGVPKDAPASEALTLF